MHDGNTKWRLLCSILNTNRVIHLPTAIHRLIKRSLRHSYNITYVTVNLPVIGHTNDVISSPLLSGFSNAPSRISAKACFVTKGLISMSSLDSLGFLLKFFVVFKLIRPYNDRHCMGYHFRFNRLYYNQQFQIQLDHENSIISCQSNSST